jgi:sugar lactone lactonase YvrE
MSNSHSTTAAWIAVTFLAVALPPVQGLAQTPQAPGGAQAGRGGGGRPQGDYNLSLRTTEEKALPNPYARDETFFEIPLERVLGSSSAIATDKDGKSIWVAERCGAQSSGDREVCVHSTVPPVMKFDENGKMVKAFGAGQIVYPHSMTIDRDGNIWIADLQSNVDRPARGGRGGGAAGGALAPAGPTGPPLTPNGNQIIKFSPEGKILLHFLVPGVYGTDTAHFSQPSAIAIAPNGDIFVADGHDSAPSNNRIMKFDKNGKFIKIWGGPGTGQSEFDCPHAMAFDSQGRLFVGDRGNNRIQIFDQEGNFLAEWKQFGKPSGLFIDKNDVIYVADSESNIGQGNAYIRGVHIGDAKTGKVTAFLPDPQGNPAPWNTLGGTTGAEGVTSDAAGNIFTAQVNPPGLAKYSIKRNVPHK